MCWTELHEHKIISPDLVKDTEEKSSDYSAEVKSCQ